MSIIAKSLKKIKKRETSTKNVEFLLMQSLPNLGYLSLFLILLLSFLFFAGDYYFFIKKTKKSELKFNIKNFEQTYYNSVNNFKKAEHKKNLDSYLKYLLITEKYQEMLKILNNIKREKPALYLKFSGILAYKERNFELAQKVLQQYISKYGKNHEVLSYIANIYYFKQNYKKALNLYNKMNIQDFEVYFNKAIILEKLKRYKESLFFYKKSYSFSKDPLLKRKIFNKIFLLKNYEQ